MNLHSDNYLIENFVADVLEVTSTFADESEILKRVGPLAQRAAANHSWRTDDMSIADPELGFGSTLLHGGWITPYLLSLIAGCLAGGLGLTITEHGR